MSTQASQVTAPTSPGRIASLHPGWYGAVMGTAIVGIVAWQDPGNLDSVRDAGRVAGLAMVGLAALLAIVLGVPYLWRWIRHRELAMADLRSPGAGALYGTFPGGILVLAVAIATVAPSLGSPDTVAVPVTVLTVVGTILAFVVGIAFAHQLFTAPVVGQEAVNGAWFIPPVVNIIVPVALVPVIARQAPAEAATLVAVGYAFFGMGLVLFLLVASLLYGRLVFHPMPAAPLAPSLWITLGPVGVGALALMRLAQAGGPAWGSAGDAVKVVSTIGATALWGFGAWWLVAALLLLAGHLRRGPLPYGVGWWAFTFPLGAFTASTLAVSRAWSSAPLEWLGAILFAALVVTWLVVAAGTVRALRTGAAWAR
jgi:C4-dicarboxylate transporter/malic acid transport protein